MRAPDVRTLRPGLHLLETELEDFDVRAAVVVGEEAVVVFDTLAHPRQTAAVAALAGSKPLTVVYSHADWDHAWGTAGVGRLRAVVALEAAAARFAADVPEELARRRAADPALWSDVVLVPPTETFPSRRDLDLGGVTLELHALPGHTSDCLVGFVPEWGVLLAGDTVETPLPVVNDGGAVAGWLTRLAAWSAHPGVATVVPSHGPVGGRALVDRTQAYLSGLLRGEGGFAVDPGEVPRPFYLETHRANLRAMGLPEP